MSLTDAVYGSETRCATCAQDKPTVAIASDKDHPKSGRWYVCARCQSEGKRLKAGLQYEQVKGQDG